MSLSRCWEPLRFRWQSMSSLFCRRLYKLSILFFISLFGDSAICYLAFPVARFCGVQSSSVEVEPSSVLVLHVVTVVCPMYTAWTRDKWIAESFTCWIELIMPGGGGGQAGKVVSHRCRSWREICGEEAWLQQTGVYLKLFCPCMCWLSCEAQYPDGKRNINSNCFIISVKQYFTRNTPLNWSTGHGILFMMIFLSSHDEFFFLRQTSHDEYYGALVECPCVATDNTFINSVFRKYV
jgi:hypothetical protein